MLPQPSIPGQTPLDDLSGLRVRWIQTTAQLNAAEAENIRKATLKYLLAKPTNRSARFDISWMKRLHQEMFGDVWTWAGELRMNETNIGSAARQVEIDLHNLIGDLRAWESSQMPILEQAVRIQHAAVKIHPFQNGNGRWSRMLANIWLLLNDTPLIEWPEVTIGTSSAIRSDYLAAVRAADCGDFVRLIALHAQFSRPQ